MHRFLLFHRKLGIEFIFFFKKSIVFPLPQGPSPTEPKPTPPAATPVVEAPAHVVTPAPQTNHVEKAAPEAPVPAPVPAPAKEEEKESKPAVVEKNDVEIEEDDHVQEKNDKNNVHEEPEEEKKVPKIELKYNYKEGTY